MWRDARLLQHWLARPAFVSARARDLFTILGEKALAATRSSPALDDCRIWQIPRGSPWHAGFRGCDRLRQFASALAKEIGVQHNHNQIG
jgi:hypothetical protein